MAPNESYKQVVYQANPNALQTMKGMKEQLHKIGKQYANRPVRVQTVDGITYEGQLSHMDGGLLFLVIPGQQTGWTPPYGYGHQGSYGQYGQAYHGNQGQSGYYDQHPGYPGQHGSYGQPYSSSGYGYTPYSRAFYGSYYNNVILPLVLYELLVISLL